MGMNTASFGATGAQGYLFGESGASSRARCGV